MKKIPKNKLDDSAPTKNLPPWKVLLNAMRQFEDGVQKKPKIAFTSQEQQSKAFRQYTKLESLLRAAQKNGPRLVVSSGRCIQSMDDLAIYLAEKHDVSRSTIWRWYRRYRIGGLHSLTRTTRADKGQSRHFSIHLDQREFVEDQFLGQKLSIARVHTELVAKFAEKSSLIPSYETVRTYIRSLPRGVTVLAIQGEGAFRKMNRGHSSDTVIASFQRI